MRAAKQLKRRSLKMLSFEILVHRLRKWWPQMRNHTTVLGFVPRDISDTRAHSLIIGMLELTCGSISAPGWILDPPRLLGMEFFPERADLAPFVHVRN